MELDLRWQEFDFQNNTQPTIIITPEIMVSAISICGNTFLQKSKYLSIIVFCVPFFSKHHFFFFSFFYSCSLNINMRSTVIVLFLEFYFNREIQRIVNYCNSLFS